MFAKFEKSVASGTVKAPPSKSVCHRLIICAALAEGESYVENISSCRDCEATINCLKALGATIEPVATGLRIIGFDPKKAKAMTDLYCDESGSTLRFLVPIALLSESETTFTGKPRLIERPHSVYEELFSKKGLQFNKADGKISVKGALSSGEFILAGNVSSQFVSGLLFALPLLEEDSKIILSTDIESRSYIDLTIDAMKKFGVKVVWKDERTLYIKGAQKYKASSLTVEGDYSGAAFIDAFNFIGGEVIIDGLSEESLQGDKVYEKLFRRLTEESPLISIKDCPDLGPILFALAAAKNGAVFTDTKRLKIKESDRAEAMAEELRKLGAEIEVYDNSVVVKKSKLREPTEQLNGHNDHRIVMSLSILLSIHGGEISGAEAVNKSYEEFFENIKSLGIKVKTYET